VVGHPASEFGMEPQGEKRHRAAGEIIAGIVDKLIIGGDVNSVGDASGWRSKLDMQPQRADRHRPAHVIVTWIGGELIIRSKKGILCEAN
jgi:hypothetical protein